MTTLALQRARDDRHLYLLGDVGTLRLTGRGWRTSVARAGSRTWNIAVRKGDVYLTDEAGGPVGSFARRRWHRGGELRWNGRALTLSPINRWRERYALVDGQRTLAILDGRGWGRRPATVTVDDPPPLEPALLLFAAFLVNRLAKASSDASAGGAAVASMA